MTLHTRDDGSKWLECDECHEEITEEEAEAAGGLIMIGEKPNAEHYHKGQHMGVPGDFEWMLNI